MKAIVSLVAASGLLIGSAAIGYAQQGGAPHGGTTAGSGSAAQFGSSPGSAAPFGSSPSQQMQPNGSAPGEPAVSGNAPGSSNTGIDRNGQTVVGGSGAWITGPGNAGGVVERHDHTISRENDVTTGRADRGGCTTQVYRVPSEATGDTTSVNVVRC
jgi:hypothetical protein